MLIDVRQGPLTLVQSSNSTTAGTTIANPADTLTRPSGAGVIDLGAGVSTGPNGLFLVPFGVGADTTTFLMSVYAWDVIPGGTTRDQWTAYLLASFTCTITTLAGVAGGPVADTQFYCDTITLVKGGTAGVSQEIVSPTTDVKASVRIATKGCRLVSVLFAMNASATSANALWRRD